MNSRWWIALMLVLGSLGTPSAQADSEVATFAEVQAIFDRLQSSPLSDAGEKESRMIVDYTQKSRLEDPSLPARRMAVVVLQREPGGQVVEWALDPQTFKKPLLLEQWIAQLGRLEQGSFQRIFGSVN